MVSRSRSPSAVAGRVQTGRPSGTSEQRDYYGAPTTPSGTPRAGVYAEPSSYVVSGVEVSKEEFEAATQKQIEAKAPIPIPSRPRSEILAEQRRVPINLSASVASSFLSKSTQAEKQELLRNIQANQMLMGSRGTVATVRRDYAVLDPTIRRQVERRQLETRAPPPRDYDLITGQGQVERAKQYVREKEYKQLPYQAALFGAGALAISQETVKHPYQMLVKPWYTPIKTAKETYAFGKETIATRSFYGAGQITAGLIIGRGIGKAAGKGISYLKPRATTEALFSKLEKPATSSYNIFTGKFEKFIPKKQLYYKDLVNPYAPRKVYAQVSERKLTTLTKKLSRERGVDYNQLSGIDRLWIRGQVKSRIMRTPDPLQLRTLDIYKPQFARQDLMGRAKLLRETSRGEATGKLGKILISTPEIRSLALKRTEQRSLMFKASKLREKAFFGFSSIRATPIKEAFVLPRVRQIALKRARSKSLIKEAKKTRADPLRGLSDVNKLFLVGQVKARRLDLPRPRRIAESKAYTGQTGQQQLLMMKQPKAKKIRYIKLELFEPPKLLSMPKIETIKLKKYKRPKQVQALGSVYSFPKSQIPEQAVFLEQEYGFKTRRQFMGLTPLKMESLAVSPIFKERPAQKSIFDFKQVNRQRELSRMKLIEKEKIGFKQFPVLKFSTAQMFKPIQMQKLGQEQRQRVSEEQLFKPMEMFKLEEKQVFKRPQLERVKLKLIPKDIFPEKLILREKLRTSKTPPLTFGFPLKRPSRRGRRIGKSKQQYGYKPSFSSIMLGIRGKVSRKAGQQRFTGLELRPLPIFGK